VAAGKLIEMCSVHFLFGTSGWPGTRTPTGRGCNLGEGLCHRGHQESLHRRSGAGAAQPVLSPPGIGGFLACCRQAGSLSGILAVNGKLPVNLMFSCDGQEEQGSPNFHPVLDRNPATATVLRTGRSSMAEIVSTRVAASRRETAHSCQETKTCRDPDGSFRSYLARSAASVYRKTRPGISETDSAAHS
jgi:hypothetical protein